MAATFRNSLQMTAPTIGSPWSSIRASARRRPGQRLDQPPCRPHPFEELIKAWLPISSALNCQKLSTAQADLYPLGLPSPALESLGFVPELIRHHSRRGD